MNDTHILPEYEVCWKSIETEVVFILRKMNNELNLHFLLNNVLIPAGFPQYPLITLRTLNHLVW